MKTKAANLHRLLCLMLLLSAPVAAFAESEEVGGEQEDPTAYCMSLSALAGKIMEGRQEFNNMPKAMEIAMSFDDGIQELVISMVRDAYDIARYSSDEYRADAVDDFRNSYLSACLEAQLE